MKYMLISLLVLAMLVGCEPSTVPEKVCEAKYTVSWDTGGYRPEHGRFLACEVEVEDGVVTAMNEYGKMRIIIADRGVLVISER